MALFAMYKALLANYFAKNSNIIFTVGSLDILSKALDGRRLLWS
jgi:hypothetical protein